MLHLASSIEQGAVLAVPRKRLIALAQKRVLDGVLDVVIVGEMPADLQENGSEDGGVADEVQRAPTLTVANASEPAVAANPMYFQRVASLAA